MRPGRGATRGSHPRSSPRFWLEQATGYTERPCFVTKTSCRHLTSAGLRRTLAKCRAAGPIRWAGSNQRVRRFPLISVGPGNRRLGLMS
jgi:hypothetical protein